MSIETILATILAIFAGGFGIFQSLAKRRYQKALRTERKRSTERLKKEVEDAKSKADSALSRYRKRAARRTKRKPS